MGLKIIVLYAYFKFSYRNGVMKKRNGFYWLLS